MYIVFGIVIIPIVVMAILLLNGKGAFLIAGYNTARKEEKSKYNEKVLCRFVGWLLIGVAFCLLLFPVGFYFEMAWLTVCAIALITLITVGAVVYINTGNHFRENVSSEVSTANEREKSKSTAKQTIIAAVVISVIMLITVGIMSYQGSKDPIINILDNEAQIEAMYGTSIDFAEIIEISLIEKSINELGVGKRTNGYGGVGGTLKGNFSSDTLGETLLFVQSKSSPTLRIERADGKDIYISFHNAETTEALYHELLASVPIR